MGLFLTWYGLVIIWILVMYYKSFRSRIIFLNIFYYYRILWNIIKHYFILLYIKELNQKKYCNLNLIYLRTKKKINKINLDNEFIFIDENKKKKFLEDEIDIEFFRNFKGCIFLYNFLCLKDGKESYNLFIFFYNTLTSDVKCYNLSSKVVNLVMQNVIMLYLVDDNDPIKLKDIIYLLDDFVKKINNEKKIFIYIKERSFFIYNCNNKKNFLLFLKKYL